MSEQAKTVVEKTIKHTERLLLLKAVSWRHAREGATAIFSDLIQVFGNIDAKTTAFFEAWVSDNDRIYREGKCTAASAPAREAIALRSRSTPCIISEQTGAPSHEKRNH